MAQGVGGTIGAESRILAQVVAGCSFWKDCATGFSQKV